MTHTKKECDGEKRKELSETTLGAIRAEAKTLSILQPRNILSGKATNKESNSYKM